MKHYCPILLFAFFCISVSYAQGFDCDISAGVSCEEAPIICHLHGFRSRLPESNSGAAPPGFCGSVQNAHWISFLARSTFMRIALNPTNCINLTGVHGRLYKADDCNGLVPIAECWDEVGPVIPIFNAANLIIGERYYIIIDGVDGDVCDYQINVMEGYIEPPELANAGLPSKLCENQNLHLDGSMSAEGENFQYFWHTTNGQIIKGENTLQPEIGALGNYILSVKNTAENCLDTDSVLITELVVSDLEVHLESQIDLDIGEPYQLNPEINLPLSEISEIVWKPAFGLSCTDCLNPVVNSSLTTRYELTINDFNGCTATSQILVNINNGGKLPVYIPNVFSPNNDGMNDRLVIYGSEFIQNISSIKVFSRWGGLVFEATNFPPNDFQAAWNGRSPTGGFLPRDVYLVQLEVELLDGRREVVFGDVLLLR